MPLKTVISGSFHRQPEKLWSIYQELTLASCQVLSPLSFSFQATDDAFVKSAEENWLTPLEIERRHLTALAHADFVWLHVPEGYIGRSTALEIGFALAKQIPLFSHTLPSEEPFKSLVCAYSSVFHALHENKLLPH